MKYWILTGIACWIIGSEILSLVYLIGLSALAIHKLFSGAAERW